MWFKNLQLYRLTLTSPWPVEALDAELQKQRFVPLGSGDRQSSGWVAPAAHAPDLWAYPHAGAVLVALKQEEKLLPASVVKDLAAERIAELEAKDQRRVGKKEARSIREQVEIELLPRAFSRSRVVRALLDLEHGWVWVDSATPARAELLLQRLRETLGSFPTQKPQTHTEPVTAMSLWLEHDAPEAFSLATDCVLQAPGEDGAQVSCRRQDLSTEEVQLHLKHGKQVTQLALHWDERLALVLTDKLQIKRLGFLELLEEHIKEADAEDAAALFDTHLSLLVHEGRQLIAALMQALGGEMTPAPTPSTTSTLPPPAAPATVTADDPPW